MARQQPTRLATKHRDSPKLVDYNSINFFDPMKYTAQLIKQINVIC